MEAALLHRVLHGDEDFALFFRRAENNPDDLKFNTVAEGLARLRADRTIVFINDVMVRGFFRKNPFHHQKLKVNDPVTHVRDVVVLFLDRFSLFSRYLGAEVVKYAPSYLLRILLLLRYFGKECCF